MISRVFSNKKNVLLTILAVLCVACLLGASLFAPTKIGNALTDVTSFKMAKGASVRTDDTRAIRFTSGIAKSDLELLQNDGNDVRVITMITPTDLLDGVDEFDADCGVEMKKVEFANAYGNLTAVEGNWDETKGQFTIVSDGTGTHYVFKAVLYNVKEYNSVRNFSARSYITVNDEVYDYTDYSEADNSRNIWDVANDHLSTLEEGDDGYANLAAIAKTHQVTVTSGIDGSKIQTISVKHYDKLSNYMSELETVTAPIVAENTHFAYFADGEGNKFNGYVTEAMSLTAKYTTLEYAYDSTKSVYYVADNKEYTGDTVIVPATYTGANGTADVKYVADYAFEGNTNIKKVILDKNVIVVGRSAFNGCTSLTYVSMPGVTAVAYEKSNYVGYNQGYEKVTPKENTFLNAPIKTLIVAENFEVQGQQFTSDSGRITRVYSMSTNPIAWGTVKGVPNASMDRVDGCILRTNENKGFIVDYETTGKSPVYYYSEGYPTDTAYIFWHYDTNGTPILWAEEDYVDTQGVNYNYDADDDCYYITYSPNVTVENLVIPEKFDDGINGEKSVKYIASIRVNNADKGAFQGNTNLKSVTLPDSIVSLNGDVFSGCSSLEYVVMRGVKRLSYDQINREYSGTVPTFTAVGKDNVLTCYELNSMVGMYKGYNFSGCTSLQYIVVGDGFVDDGTTRYNFSVGANIKVYVFGSNTPTFSLTTDRTFTIYTYSVEDPQDGSRTWYYDNGVIKEHKVLVMTDEQGILYGWDSGRQSYYVANNQSYAKAVVRIPATFDDGVHGEKKVEYVGDYAFNGNKNITKVILHVNVIVVGKQAFRNCTSLVYVSMLGVKTVSNENNGAYKNSYVGLNKGGTSTFGNSPIQQLIVPDGFDVRGTQFDYSTQIIRVYSFATTPAEWTGDRASNCLIRSGNTNGNTGFIYTYEEPSTSPIYYYSDKQPTDTDYIYWHYDTDGETILLWDVPTAE